MLHQVGAARVLAMANASDAIPTLLELFFGQSEEIELYETALTIEHNGDPAPFHDSLAAGWKALEQHWCSRRSR